MCVGALACMDVTCMQCPKSPEGGIESFRTGIADSCDPPCGFWNLNMGPME